MTLEVPTAALKPGDVVRRASCRVLLLTELPVDPEPSLPQRRWLVVGLDPWADHRACERPFYAEFYEVLERL